MITTTLYEILEVIPTASPQTIKAAYISLIKRFHPDVAGNSTLDLTQEITHAYSILGDTAKRAAYDEELSLRQAIDAGNARPAENVTTAVTRKQAGPEPNGRTVEKQPRTIVVSPSSSGERVISAAIKNAAPGSLILVRPGLYRDFLNLDRQIEIAGDGPAEDIIIESTDGSCVEMRTESAVVRGLTLRSRAAQMGTKECAAWVTVGRLTIEDCDLSGDTLANVLVDKGADITMRRCRIHHGAQRGIYFSGAATGLVEECGIWSCGNDEIGGGGILIDEQADPKIVNCKIWDCRCYGVSSDGGRGAFENCEISGNLIAGVFLSDNAATVFRHCIIRDSRPNDRWDAHGVWAYQSAAGRFEDCDIPGNDRGVVVGADCTTRFDDCRIQGHMYGVVSNDPSRSEFYRCKIRGGSQTCVLVSKQAHPTLHDCTLWGGQVGVTCIDNGLGLFVGCEIHGMTDRGTMIADGSAPVFQSCEFHHNKSFGVAAVEKGAGTVEDCDIFNNGLSGVGLSEGSTLTVRNCTIRQNMALGVYADKGAFGLVEGCNLTGNKDGPILIRHSRTIERNNRTDGVYVNYTGR